MKALRSTTIRGTACVAPLIVGLFGGGGIAAAQEPTPDQQSAIRSNCRSDFMANCSGVPRGGKEAMQCLKDNVAKLSSGCQQAVKAVMPAAAPKPPAPPVIATPAVPPAAPPAPAAAPPAPVAETSTSPAATPPATAPEPATATPAAPTSAPPASKPTMAKPAAPAAAPKSAATPPAGALPPPAATAAPAVIVVAPVRIFALVRTQCRAEYRAYCSDVDIGVVA